MTVEEIEIIVTAKVEEALKEFQKIMPELQKAMKQAEEAFSKVDTKAMTNKFHQAVNFMKKKMQDLKKSSENNEIAIKVNNKDAQKQITQIEKEIDSLQKKITGRQLKLDITNNTLDKMRNDTNQSVIKEMPDAGNKRITQETYKKLDNNTNYQSLVKQSDKLNSEIEKYNALLNSAKSKMAELGQQTSKASTTQNKLSSFFGAFKQKVEQAKPSIASIGKSFNDMPKITQNVTNNIKGMGTKLKSGLGHVLKYAGALFSLQSIYSTLSGCAQSWLSSQNAGAKQLSANIDYMKYAMGSAFAPVIQYVTNLVYQLMKAIQSVVYALFKVNIFANASAKSYASMAGSAKKASKETNKMADIDEIHNIQKDSDSSGGSGGGGSAPSFDLSKVNGMNNSIIDAIKNGDWYSVGKEIGLKINEAMNNIPWDKIQNTAKKIGTNIALFLNGAIDTIDWNKVGNTFAQGLNTVVYAGYQFVITFKWKNFGKAIGNAVNGFVRNVDWNAISSTFSKGISGILDSITGFIETLDWDAIIDAAIESVKGLDFSDFWSSFFELLGAALGSLTDLAVTLSEKIGTFIRDSVENSKDYFSEKTDECGGNVGEGILKGIVDKFLNIDKWIKDNIYTPFLQGFCEAFGIEGGTSLTYEELGNNIMQGLMDGIKSLISKLKEIWERIKNIISNVVESIKVNVTTAFNNIKTGLTDIMNKVKDKMSDIWNGIWGTIKNVINNILEGTEKLINGISKGINKLLSGINDVANSVGDKIGLDPINLQVNTVSLPRLAKGGVLTEATAVIAGEYSGAKSNPEIVTPQNIMAETMRNVLKERNSNNDTINFVNELKVNGKTFAREIIQDLNDEAKRLGYKPILERG